MTSHGASLLRGRDIAALFIFLLGVYMSLTAPRFKYSFQPAFYLNQAGIASGQLVNDWEVLPPVVTDIDGDGLNEMIFITPDMSLNVYQPQEASQTLGASEIYVPALLASVPLKSVNLKRGKVPILVRTGYTTEGTLLQKRKQVIVVVREDLTVTCYNYRLQVIWEKSISHSVHGIGTDLEHFIVDEASLVITPMSVTEEGEGMVVVGTSFVKRNDLDDEITLEENLDMHREDLDAAVAAGSAGGGSTVKPDHFSVVCLDGKTGKFIWKHDGMEVHAEQFTKSLPQHAYQMDVHDLEGQLHRAPGVSDWNSFRSSLVHQLPHTWESPQDTEMRLAKFVRQHVGAGARHQGTTRSRSKKGQRKSGRILQTEKKNRGKGNVVTGQGKFSGVVSEPASASVEGVINAATSTHSSNPNVLVAHTSKGLEVISLLTGSPITSLALSTGPTYSDLDGDGLVDSLYVLKTKEDALFQAERMERKADEVHHCSIMALSGLPPRAQLFNASVCPGHGTLTEPLKGSGRKGGGKLADVVGVAPPLVLKTTDTRTRKESKVRDVITAIHSGTITSITGQGTFNWQIRDGPTWNLEYEDAHVMSFDTDAYRASVGGTHDNRFSHIVVTGQNQMALLSRDGDVLATSDVPQAPVIKPIFTDFNGDGLSDIIVVTADAVLGYQLEAHASVRGILIAFFALAMVAVVMFLSSIRDDGSVEKANRPTWSRLGTKRSTDATFHID